MAKKDLAGIAGNGSRGSCMPMKELTEVRVSGQGFIGPPTQFCFGVLSGVPVVSSPPRPQLPRLGNQPAWREYVALKSIGVNTIVSASAVSSLKQELAPAHFVFPDQFVDETKGRASTFFGQGMVGHVPMAEPFCMGISDIMYTEAKELGITSHGRHIHLHGRPRLFH